jgi:hypothetical protein
MKLISCDGHFSIGWQKMKPIRLTAMILSNSSSCSTENDLIHFVERSRCHVLQNNKVYFSLFQSQFTDVENIAQI